MGIGSKIKERIRKIIPNELSEIAVKAAPFVAPFNPAIAAAMAGIGGFDQTGRIGKSLKSMALTYGLGNLARGIGGAGPQWGFKSTAPGIGTGFGSYFTSPMSGAQLWGTPANPITTPAANLGTGAPFGGGQIPISENPYALSGEGVYTDMQLAGGDVLPEAHQVAGYVTGEGGNIAASEAANAAAGVTTGGVTSTTTGTGFTWKAFMEAPLGTKWDMTAKWFGSLEGSTKLALGLGSVAAAFQYLENQAMQDDKINVTDYKDIVETDYATRGLAKDGGIIGLAQGGEPVVEMDYRGGGFIPVGAQERADDVPARLSKNEFVMTADAVRAAGGGSINLGSQRMYDLMNRLEAAA